MHEFLGMSATALAARIRQRELSPVEVVEAHIEQIERVNPWLNAVVEDCFEEARDQARRAEQAVMVDGQEELGPLHGVPCTIKEMLSVEGRPITAGSALRRGLRAERDAVVVERLRRAGAIVLGITNQSEMGLWIESVNAVYGRTNNPYDPERIAGGSSGGEGAIIGAGGSPFGIGSDMGGSIRIPALYCGIFGHKPSHGLVPRSGHFPDDFTPQGLGLEVAPEMVTVGPMCRRAEDLMTVLRVISGPAASDPVSAPRQLGDPEAVDPRGLKVWLMEDVAIPLTSSTTHEQRRAVQRAGLVLEDAGATVEYWEPRRMSAATEIYLAELWRGAQMTLAELVGGGQTPRLGEELMRRLRGDMRHMAPVLMLCLGEMMLQPDEARMARAAELREELRAEIADRLGDDGLLILPTMPRPAPRHHSTMLRPFDLVYAAVFNALRLPVTAAPTGMSRRRGADYPVGVQIVAGDGHDHLGIAAARLLEQGTGGWLMPRRAMADVQVVQAPQPQGLQRQVVDRALGALSRLGVGKGRDV